MPCSLANIPVHTVFSTKNRVPFLQDPLLRREFFAYMAGILKNLGCVPVIIGGIADHVHLLFFLSKGMGISETIMNLKRASSLWIKQRDKSLLGFSWQESYAMFPVDLLEIDGTKGYIERQENHHLGVSFQDELRGFYKQYNIPLDERYVWD